MSPDQRVYTQIYESCGKLFGVDNVYEKLPGHVPYPFVLIGEQVSNGIRVHKDHLNKDTVITIYVWHNRWDKRGDVSAMLYQIEQLIFDLFGPDGEIMQTQIISHTESGEHLLQGIIQTNIRI